MTETQRKLISLTLEIAQRIREVANENCDDEIVALATYITQTLSLTLDS